MTSESIPGVVFQPNTYQALMRGIDKLVNAIRPTLGPLPRLVAVSQFSKGKSPELLDDGGLIARRVIALPDRDEDMGAMFLRHVLWQQHEEVGDGTATTAVLLQSIFRQSIHHVVSGGGNAMLLARFFEKGLRAILTELERKSILVRDPKQIDHLTCSICPDQELSAELVNVFKVIGANGYFETREGRGRSSNHQFVEGHYWDKGVFSQRFIFDPLAQKSEFEDAAVFVSDMNVTEPQELVNLLNLCIECEAPALLLICNTLSEKAQGFLLMESTREKIPVLAVQTPGADVITQAGHLEDLAKLTGAKAVINAAGDLITQVTEENLGRARKVWGDKDFFGIVGGKGDKIQLRRHISSLQAAMERSEDLKARAQLRKRMGRLKGGAAILWVGGITESEIAVRKAMTEKAAETLRGALLEGILPGGGMAYLDCRPAVQALMEHAETVDERAAYRILLRALEEPFRVIVENAGFNADKIMGQMEMMTPGHGFDIRKGKFVPFDQNFVFDSTSVMKAVAHKAISSAGLLLSVDVLVHHRKLEPEVNP